MSSDANNALTIRAAYLSRGASDEIAIILGSMALLSDGVSADPAMLNDFEESVREVLRQESTGGYAAANFGAR